MTITVFAKRRRTKEGKQFYVYVARLVRKSGETHTVAVRFREVVPPPRPEDCPMNIVIEKGNANLSSSNYVREDTGLTATTYTLWVSDWEPGEPYVDHTLDDFM